MNKDQNKDKNTERRGVDTQNVGRAEGAERKSRRSSSAKKTTEKSKSIKRESTGKDAKPANADTKQSLKNNSHHVDIKGMMTMLAIDLVIGVIIALLCYLLSKNVGNLQTLMMYFGMLILLGVILHIVVDLIMKRIAHKDDEGEYPLLDRSTGMMYAVAFFIMLLAASASFAKIANDNLHHDNIYEGVYLYDIDVSNMTYQQAMDETSKKVQSQMQMVNFDLYVDDTAHNFNASNLGMTSDLEAKLTAAYNYARVGSVFTRLDQVFRLRTQPQNFAVVFTPNANNISDAANSIANSVYTTMTDATMEFTPWGDEDFVYTADVVGKEISTSDIINAVNYNCQNMQFEDVHLNTTLTNPAVTLEQLQQGTVLLSTYTTTLEDDSNRTSNVDLASTMAEGIVMPGDTFSFNEATGERTREKGFKVAHAIANGTELIDAVAGGVCQAASTLHAALLYTDVTMVERHNHSFKVGYMSAGMDATVDYYMPLDFKFQNTTGYPVYISCFVTYNEPDQYGIHEHTLTVNIYGTNTNPDREIDIRVETLETYAGGFNKKYTSNLPSGTMKYTAPRVSGRKTNTYRDVYVNGELVESILVYEEDIYHSVNGTILVGTG